MSQSSLSPTQPKRLAAATTREELVREAIFTVLLSFSREAEEEGGEKEGGGSYSLVKEQLAENLKASISTEERTISTGATYCSYLVSGKKVGLVYSPSAGGQSDVKKRERNKTERLQSSLDQFSLKKQKTKQNSRARKIIQKKPNGIN